MKIPNVSIIDQPLEICSASGSGKENKFHYNRQPRMTACDTHTVLGAKEAEKGDLKIRDFA